MPLFLWSTYATSVILVLATPVLAMALILIGVERAWGIGIFDPELGGDPVLFQHLFWFYSHPVVYVMVLPAMGIVSEIITCFARKHIFGYVFIAWASVGIAVLGFLGVGASHVRRRPVGLLGHDLFGPQLSGRRAVGHQGLQLDGDALQRFDLV